MTDSGAPWDGRGLPPVAAARVAQAASSGVASSLLSAPAAASLAGCGLVPVGEVMGAIVQHIGSVGYGCSYGARTISSGSGSRWAGLSPYVDAVQRGWNTALSRLLQEATALGADGVVGVRLTRERLGLSSDYEFLALGTAVVGRGRVHAERPFLTDLDGQDVAKLLHGGWVPTGIAIGVAAAVRHDDYGTRRQASSWGNVEVGGYTDLVTQVRDDARTQFHRRAVAIGGEAATVSDMTLDVWEYEPSDNHRDHYASATVTGTVAARFHRGRSAPTDSLTILSLNRTQEGRR